MADASVRNNDVAQSRSFDIHFRLHATRGVNLVTNCIASGINGNCAAFIHKANKFDPCQPIGESTSTNVSTTGLWSL